MTPTDQINMLRDALKSCKGDDTYSEDRERNVMIRNVLAATSSPPAASQDAQPVARSYCYTCDMDVSKHCNDKQCRIKSIAPEAASDSMEKFTIPHVSSRGEVFYLASDVDTHPAPEAAAPATQSTAGDVDCNEFKRLVNEYRSECELVQGHGVPAWRKLVAFVNAWHAAHIAASKPAAASGEAVYQVQHNKDMWQDISPKDFKTIEVNNLGTVRTLYTAPPTAQPVEQATLTDDQIVAVWQSLPGIKIHNEAASKGINTNRALNIAFARAIIAALKGKP